MPISGAEPVVLTVTTGVTPLAGQRDYNYVGTFPGVQDQSGTPFKGGAPLKKLVSYGTGVTAPWARLPMVFKV